MKYRPLGTTGINASAISFGAGPIPALLTGDDRSVQRETVNAAIAAGINWFDTAATYAAGRSEESLGATLHDLGASQSVHVASKVRLMPEHLGDIAASVRDSVAGSLRRLKLERITLLQLHNSITPKTGDEPTSLTPAHVLSPGGVLDAMSRLQRDGLVEHLGLTGIGNPTSLAEVIAAGPWATIQTPYNLLNPTAGEDIEQLDGQSNYGNIIARCAERRMGVFAIRVLAGGALVGQPPSVHTLTTKFFPLALYEHDRRTAAAIEQALPPGVNLKEVAVRFALSHPHVTSAIVGFSDPQQVREVVRLAAAGPLAAEMLESVSKARARNASPESIRSA